MVRVPTVPVPEGSAHPGAVLTLRGVSTARRPGEPLSLWRSPSSQLVAVGLLVVLVHVVIVATALSGLQEVARANAAVARIVTAQRAFQDADMAHDAMLASALATLTERSRLLGELANAPSSSVVLGEDAGEFRRQLANVDRVDLPDDLEALLRSVRSTQLDYVDSAEALSATWTGGGAVPPERVQAFRQVHQRLTVLQEAVTTTMGQEADRRAEAAAADRQDVQGRLIASGIVALLALLGVTWLLHRMGRDLAALLARERGVAETLQDSLLPDRLPELPGLRLAARYRPGSVGTQVGGDWYDVMPLPGGRVGLVMGDVVGHDLHAASSMGQLRNALRACAAEGAAPHEVLERLNRLCVTQDLGEMATVLYAVLDPVSGIVEIANAGHCPPLLVQAEQARLLEARACPPVGVVREARYTSTSYAVPAGSLLLLYTDGLVERRDAAVDAGLEQLLRVASAHPDTDLEAVCDQILAGMLDDAPSDDDVALLLIAPQAQLGAHIDVLWPAQAERLSLLRSLLERWLTEAGADEDEVYDVLVACSEAATNAIEHAYGPARADISVRCDLDDGVVTIAVRDWGQWREARGQDRGRGLGLMRELMDDVEVLHGDGGTQVRLRRRLQRAAAVPDLATAT